jgi:hypothetical protein
LTIKFTLHADVIAPPVNIQRQKVFQPSG